MKKEKLDRILADHALYWETDGKEGAIANLSNTDLSRIDLSGDNLSRANLSQSDLSGADLRGANLSCANLRGANLCDADLSDTDLSGVNLGHTDLSGALLSGAKIDLAIEDGLLRRVALKILGDRGSFDNEVWHNYCSTVHCIAGHACLMAKDRNIEGMYGTEMAGLMLLGVEARNHFYDTTEDALEWLEEVAERPVTSA